MIVGLVEMVTQEEDATIAPGHLVGADVVGTARLVLRRLVAADAADVARWAGDWHVAHMLADMPHPLSEMAAKHWIRDGGDHDQRFAIMHDGLFIGSVSACRLEGIDPPATDPPGDETHGTLPQAHIAELGFWLGRPWWGHGYAREAAAAVATGLLAAGGLAALTSGHFEDNPASSRVLTALGFTPTGTSQAWCMARGQTVAAVRYALHREGG